MVVLNAILHNHMSFAENLAMKSLKGDGCQSTFWGSSPVNKIIIEGAQVKWAWLWLVENSARSEFKMGLNSIEVRKVIKIVVESN